VNFEGIKLLAKLNLPQSIEDYNKAVSFERDRTEGISSLKADIDTGNEQLSSFNFFSRIFARKKFETIKDNIAQLQSRVTELEGNAPLMQKAQEQQDNLQAQVSALQEQYNLSSTMIDYIKQGIVSLNENGQIVIDATRMQETAEKDEVDESKDNNIPNENLVIVHKTSKFPENDTILTNYDGKKTYEKYATTESIFSSIARNNRHTSHYTLNNTVVSHGFGNWSKTGICVIDNYSAHSQEICNKDPSDTWIRNSVSLSENAVIMVTEESFSNLSEEERQNPKIVVVKVDGAGQFDNAVKNVILGFNLPLIKINPQDATHNHSNDFRYEAIWEKANVFMPLISKDKTIHDKSLTFDREEIGRFAFLVKKDEGNIRSQEVFDKTYRYTDENNQTYDIPKSLIATFFYGGLQRNEDGSYTKREDYQELLKEITAIEEIKSFEEYSKAIDLFIKNNNLVDVFNMVKEHTERFDNEPTPDKEELLSTPIGQLTTFDKYKSLLEVRKIFEQDSIAANGTNIKFLTPEGLLEATIPEYHRDAQNDEVKVDRTYEPNDTIIEPINDTQFIVRFSNGCTLGEAMAVANTIKVGTLEELQSQQQATDETPCDTPTAG